MLCLQTSNSAVTDTDADLGLPTAHI